MEDEIQIQQPEDMVAKNNIDIDNFESEYIEYANKAESDSLFAEYEEDINQVISSEGLGQQPQEEFDDIDLEEDIEIDLTQEPLEVDAKQDLGFGRDVALGLMQVGRSTARGVVNAYNEILDIGSELDEMMNLPVLQILDENGNFDLELLSQEEKKAANIKSLQIPNLDKQATFTVMGSMIESISQFMTGLKGIDKIFKSSKYLTKADDVIKAAKGGKVASLAIKGALADTAAFDEQEERLSNLIESVPALQNPITSYLQADPNDSTAEAKLKQAIEGLALGAIGDGLFRGISAHRKARKARKELKELEARKARKEARKGLKELNESDEYKELTARQYTDLVDLPAEEAAGIGIEREAFAFLGDVNTKDLLIPKASRAEKLKAGVEETKDITAKEVKEGAERLPQKTDELVINFNAIEGAQDVKNLMSTMANDKRLIGKIQKSRRGVRDVRTTLRAATDIDGFDELINRRTGEAYNAEQIIAARKVYYDTTEKLMEAATRAASPEASKVDQFMFRKMIAVHEAVQKEFMGVRAEAGRALQAWSIPVGKTGADRVRELENILNAFGGADTSQELARRIKAVGNNLNTSQINAIVKKSGLARTRDAMLEAWTLGLLTNPVTHVVNAGSNVLTGVTLGAERVMASLPKDSAITLKEATNFFHAYFASQKEALKNGAVAFRTGEVGIGLGKIELPPVRATSQEVLDAQGAFKPFGLAADYMGRGLGIVGKSLAAGDEYSKTLLYKAQLKALATRDGIAKGLDGEALKKHIAQLSENPSNEIRADAVQFANYGTFTKELGKTGQDVQRIIARYPGLRLIAPFVRTPANIFKFTFERTPLAPLSKRVREDIAAGGIKRNMALTKISMGSTIMAIGSDLALNGKITGSGPTDPKARAALRRTGWQPYSIKIGDKYYSYRRFEPVATILGMSADLAEILSNYEAYDIHQQEQVDELVYAGVIAISNQVIGKTFLQGFADTTELLSDPQRHSAQYLQRYAGSIVPAGIAGLERAMDPEMEQVFNMMDAIKARIPGLSKDVPNRVNVWGEEIKTFYPDGDKLTDSTVERLSSLINPVYYSKEGNEPVDKFLSKNGFNINMPAKIQSFDGIRINLKDYPEIYHRLAVLRGAEVSPPAYGGRNMKEVFNDMVTHSDFRSTGFFLALKDAEAQQTYISKIVKKFSDEAKKKLLLEFPVLENIIAEERKKQQEMLGNRGSQDFMPIPIEEDD